MFEKRHDTGDRTILSPNAKEELQPARSISDVLSPVPGTPALLEGESDGSGCPRDGGVVSEVVRVQCVSW